MPSTGAIFSATFTIDPRYSVGVRSSLFRCITDCIIAMTRPMIHRPTIQKAIAVNKNLDLLSSGLATTLRLWRGTWGAQPAKTAEELLVLYDREDGAECRLVREALTELNLDAMVYP